MFVVFDTVITIFCIKSMIISIIVSSCNKTLQNILANISKNCSCVLACICFYKAHRKSNNYCTLNTIDNIRVIQGIFPILTKYIKFKWRTIAAPS
ncbi:hypothetical protein GDO81_000250 [Engystomops pustulosus]|uniref:Secreted protein n=1 Tax=Engystomops pustulosus TaxID=76066 RepID=A0AAV7D5Y6_ENGPU|nr:hypothetical protein GDO81_000250 [Engystomops pustulosus]